MEKACLERRLHQIPNVTLMLSWPNKKKKTIWKRLEDNAKFVLLQKKILYKQGSNYINWDLPHCVAYQSTKAEFFTLISELQEVKRYLWDILKLYSSKFSMKIAITVCIQCLLVAVMKYPSMTLLRNPFLPHV